MTTSPAPELASIPRCTRCQSLAQPSSAEYWHMGETTMRLASSRPASRIGENKTLIGGSGFWGGAARVRSALDGFQIGDDVTYLIGVKGEFRHVSVTGHDAFTEGLLQRLDPIAPADLAERNRLLVGAVAGGPDGMAGAAIFRQKFLTALHVLGRGRPHQTGCQQNREWKQPHAAGRRS